MNLFDVQRTVPQKRRTILVDTTPRDARGTGSINLGLEIARQELDADVCHWSDPLPDPDQYETVAFNVFYPMNLLNVVPFLRRNGIPFLHDTRGDQRVIAGGPGVGQNGILFEIAQYWPGELDHAENSKQIVSDPVMRDGRAAIELTRGCRYRCWFCEYSWNCKLGYREKPFELVCEQIRFVREHGIREINFMSANFAGYTHVQDLVNYAIYHGVKVTNSDICVVDVPRIVPVLKHLPKYLKLGIESFTPHTRAMAGKAITDDQLLQTIRLLLEHASALHFYLIYGLPGDNYLHWLRWVAALAKIRGGWRFPKLDMFLGEVFENIKPIRFEFSITNFEPAPGTPFADAPMVDFDAKDRFLRDWTASLKRHRFCKADDVDYANARGRYGRKQLSYEMLMKLKRGGPELTDALIHALPNGVGRSVSDDEALRFLNYGGAND